MSGAGKHGRGMRPAGGNRWSPQRVKDELTVEGENIGVVSGRPVVGENTRVVPLSVEAEEFSLRTVPKIWIPTGEDRTVVGTVYLLGRLHGGVVGRSDAVVLWPALPGRLLRPTLPEPMFRPLPE